MSSFESQINHKSGCVGFIMLPLVICAIGNAFFGKSIKEWYSGDGNSSDEKKIEYSERIDQKSGMSIFKLGESVAKVNSILVNKKLRASKLSSDEFGTEKIKKTLVTSNIEVAGEIAETTELIFVNNKLVSIEMTFSENMDSFGVL